VKCDEKKENKDEQGTTETPNPKHTRKNAKMEHNTNALAASRRVTAIARHVEASAPSAAELLDLHRTAATNQGGLLKGQVLAHALLQNPHL
jgi:hypothetical protein